MLQICARLKRRRQTWDTGALYNLRGRELTSANSYKVVE